MLRAKPTRLDWQVIEYSIHHYQTKYGTTLKLDTECYQNSFAKAYFTECTFSSITNYTIEAQCSSTYKKSYQRRDEPIFDLDDTMGPFSKYYEEVITKCFFKDQNKFPDTKMTFLRYLLRNIKVLLLYDPFLNNASAW